MTWEAILDFSVQFDSNQRKSEYTELLVEHSFDVPSLQLRKQVLERILGEENFNSKNWLGCNQFIVGIVFSTLTLKDLTEIGELVDQAISFTYNVALSKKLHFKFLDYIISNDWGKVLILTESNPSEYLERLVNSEYYYDSDEFSSLLVKLWVSSEGKAILSKFIDFEKSEMTFFKLMDSMKGKSGGLIREVGFSLKGQPFFISNDYFDTLNLVKYIKLRKFDDNTAYYVIMMALKVLHYDFSKLFKSDSDLSENLKKMLLTQGEYQFYVYSLIQEKLILNNLKTYKFDNENQSKLLNFYESILSEEKSISQFNIGRVGVIITTFNPNVAMLRLAILSIQNQSYQNIQICLVDDGSSEEVLNDIKDMVTKFDNLKVVVNEKNIGQYASRNVAMESLKDCEFYAIQDDDDISHPQRIECQLKALVSNEAQICLTEQVRFSQDVKYVQDKMNPLSFDFGPATSLFRSSVVRKLGGFSLVRTRGDVEFIKRIQKNYDNQSVVKLQIPLYLMRYSTGSVSASKDFFLKTQLNVFRYMMQHKDVAEFVNGQQYALNN